MLTQGENHLCQQVGPGTPTGEYIRRYWVPVLLSADLSGPDSDPLRVKIHGNRHRYPARQAPLAKRETFDGHDAHRSVIQRVSVPFPLRILGIKERATAKKRPSPTLSLYITTLLCVEWEYFQRRITEYLLLVGVR